MFLAMSLVNWHIIKDKIWVHWFSLFLENITSWASLLTSGLNDIFCFCADSDIFCRSLSNTSAEVLLLCTIENREVSLAKSFTVDSVFSGKSVMYIRKMTGPRIDPCGTPTRCFVAPIKSFADINCLTGNTVGWFFFTAYFISLSMDVGSIVLGIPGYFFIFFGTLK